MASPRAAEAGSTIRVSVNCCRRSRSFGPPSARRTSSYGYGVRALRGAWPLRGPRDDPPAGADGGPRGSRRSSASPNAATVAGRRRPAVADRRVARGRHPPRTASNPYSSRSQTGGLGGATARSRSLPAPTGTPSRIPRHSGPSNAMGGFSHPTTPVSAETMPPQGARRSSLRHPAATRCGNWTSASTKRPRAGRGRSQGAPTTGRRRSSAGTCR